MKSQKQSYRSSFSSKDYRSGDGMLTAVWGPALWHTLHTISFNYPVDPTPEQKEDYYQYFRYLQKVLPCGYCRDNISKNYKKLRFGKHIFKNRDTLARWVYNLHVHVNKMLGKCTKHNYTQVRDMYEHFRARCRSKKTPRKTRKGTSKRRDKGCVNPLHGVKSKCVLRIVPKNCRSCTFSMDPRCRCKSTGKK